VEGKESRRLVEAGPETGGFPSLELPGGTHRLAVRVCLRAGACWSGVAVSPAAWCVITKTHMAVRACGRRTGMCR
jgi:hypothetical protein